MIHRFDWPDRFVTGTVGVPGQRTFFLQAREGSRVVSVVIEKQQSAALADGVDTLLDDLMGHDGNPFGIPAEASEGLRDDEPLDEPVIETFRVGAMTLAWDPSSAQVVIQAVPWVEDEEERAEGADPEQALVVSIPIGTARAFADRARRVVRQGRPLCPVCEEPMDPSGHVCPIDEA